MSYKTTNAIGSHSFMKSSLHGDLYKFNRLVLISNKKQKAL